MSFNEKIALAMRLGDWVNTIWNFHSIINVAFLGWAFTKRSEWSRWEKALLTIVYALIMAVNLKSQIVTHVTLDAALAEIRASVAHVRFETKGLPAILRGLADTNYWFLCARHLVVDAFAIAAIWWPQKKTAEAVTPAT